MIVVVDHFDSFVETLARYVREAGRTTRLIRVDRLDDEGQIAAAAAGIIISPGPGRPADTPQTVALIRSLPATPILGVCLGHLALCEAYGGATIPAPNPMHGRASLIHHRGDAPFVGLPNPFRAGRYHSLIGTTVDGGPLDPIAWDEEGVLMAVRHRSRPHIGVQFHPESLLTPTGRRIIAAFLMTAVPDAP